MESEKKVAEISRRDPKDVRVAVSPYRICPLELIFDHQGGIVSAMTSIRAYFLVLFHPMMLRVDEDQLLGNAAKLNGSGHVKGSSISQEECSWGNYARGAVFALQKRGNHLTQGIIGYICGAEGLDSSGLSSSAAVGVAYLLAFESANKLIVSPTENIEYNRLIENEYLGPKNGILDQSAILLSSYSCLTCMDCKTKEHRLVRCPELYKNHDNETEKQLKILLAFSGLKQALITNPGYNSRVAECREAAKILLH